MINQERKFKQLKVDRVIYKREIKAEKEKLIQLIRSVYLLGTKETNLKMLLDCKNPNQLSRVFIYYSYIQQAKIHAINKYYFLLKGLKKNKIEIRLQKQKLRRLKSKKQKKYNQIAHMKKKRRRLLDQINSQIKTKEQRLKALLENKKSLEKVINKIKKKKLF